MSTMSSWSSWRWKCWRSSRGRRWSWLPYRRSTNRSDGRKSTAHVCCKQISKLGTKAWFWSFHIHGKLALIYAASTEKKNSPEQQRQRKLPFWASRLATALASVHFNSFKSDCSQLDLTKEKSLFHNFLAKMQKFQRGFLCEMLIQQSQPWIFIWGDHWTI